MQLIISTLENNLFNGILIKKGENKIAEKICLELIKDITFKQYVEKGFIKIEEKKELKPKTPPTNNGGTNNEPAIYGEPDNALEDLKYQELVKLAKSKGIQTNKKKKEEIIKELRGE